jgi:hypothetical protein
MTTPMIHLIIGKWRTPNHSNKKSIDDSHQVKEEILHQIRELSKKQNKKDYRKQIGDNPDIGINDNGLIILIGRGDFKKRPYYVTEIPADDYFVLSFISIHKSDEVEIQLMTSNFDNDDDDKNILFLDHYDKLYIIPNKEIVIRNVMDFYFEKNDEMHDAIIIIE